MNQTKNKKSIEINKIKTCPYLDNDCKDVRNHFNCWVGSHTDHPFPGSCPFVIKKVKK